MALAGGVLLMLAPQTHYFEAPLLLSRSGACHAFDARADGYVRGEGAGAVLLKRLADARRDGDRVLAVIRGSAVNNDGQATRLTAPSTEMQQQLFRSAVELAGIDPGEVGLVEAHGPGTSVGDPIEYSSIQAVYGHSGRGRCALGSLKTNIGHTEPVSGIAGVIKAVECLRRGLIPPNRNFAEWNPGIDREQNSRLFVPTGLTRWPVSGKSRLAAVYSYGVSGTNGHIVLETAAAPRKKRPARRAGKLPAGKRLFVLSGASEASLTGAAGELAHWAEGEGAGVPVDDVAHTLAWRHGARTVARVRTGPATAPPDTEAALTTVRPDGSYLITGTFGGLGLLTVQRLAERGARTLVLVGRTTTGPETQRRLEALRTVSGTHIEMILGDIAEPDTVHRALNAADGHGSTLRGIVHADGVLEDATLTRLDTDLLHRVWRGKAERAWQLHQATVDAELDFFVVYSSVASLLGSPGQGAYAPANAYLDALVTHRLAEGLPATGIHWGAWSKVGRGQHLAERGFVMINPDDGLDALERILSEGHHQIAYSPLDAAAWMAPYPDLRDSTLLAELLTGPQTATLSNASPVLDNLHAATRDAERRRLFTEFIVGQVRELLGNTTRHIGPHTSLVAVGLDSLGAVQLQQRLATGLRTEIAPGTIWVKPSPAALADALLEQAGLLRPAETEREESR